MSKRVKCAHCKSVKKRKSMIKDNNLYFCCAGCKSVYMLLQHSNKKRRDTLLKKMKIFYSKNRF